MSTQSRLKSCMLSWACVHPNQTPLKNGLRAPPGLGGCLSCWRKKILRRLLQTFKVMLVMELIHHRMHQTHHLDCCDGLVHVAVLSQIAVYDLEGFLTGLQSFGSGYSYQHSIQPHLQREIFFPPPNNEPSTIQVHDQAHQQRQGVPKDHT